METFLLILSLLVLVVGLVGAIVPAVPGPPLSFIGFVLFMFTPYLEWDWTNVLITGAIAIAITALDFYVPAWGAKKLGGTKYATTGSLVGLLLGILFFPPLGILIGPFLGAFIGELIFAGKNPSEALKIGWGAFLGFLLGTTLKIGYSFIILGYILYQWVN